MAETKGVDGVSSGGISREDVSNYLAEIGRKLIDSKSATLHCMLAINQLLRLPEASQVFTGEVKDQARDLWLKLKANGLQLGDPPLLFGLPADFREIDQDDEVTQ
jgi:hypothetical protein